jgi:hypothetical protein
LGTGRSVFLHNGLRIDNKLPLTMAIWVLLCKRYGKIFAYCEISESLLDYFFPKKPVMLPEGIECQCPACKAKFIPAPA